MVHHHLGHAVGAEGLVPMAGLGVYQGYEVVPVAIESMERMEWDLQFRDHGPVLGPAYYATVGQCHFRSGASE